MGLFFETNARNGCCINSTWNMERCHDTIGYHVRRGEQYTSPGIVELRIKLN